ncbi:PAS domain-containing protein [Ktedonosporobacter rubrisoli]|uniref:histidine kinase n=1 Tax=Ktedonosporobacter rubrisoli TaxID=2509675 RepID=A0A4P6JS30_KTERU|nr:PAS domain-containing protein [Ktedonosporobacter rubrisoli]QBD78123.1 PAS domain-containing protein [Ktedonosporobacter rubrisoli]
MELGQAEQLEYILGRVSVGVAILDSSDFRVSYANAYLRSLLGAQWRDKDIVGQAVNDVLPEAVSRVALPLLERVALSGERLQFYDIPYEGFLEVRGRTYWQITLERSPNSLNLQSQTKRQEASTLLITIEEVTERVRSHVHLNAIHHISSAIASASALPLVLDRILEALQELVGSKRCAIFLAEQPEPDVEALLMEGDRASGVSKLPRRAIIAAQKGVHPLSQSWHPLIDQHTLLGRVIARGRTIIVTDTHTMQDVELPQLVYKGEPRRPGSVLCVPIFETYPAAGKQNTQPVEIDGIEHKRTVLGTIEVYHRRARGFPAEEVELLERFAMQAGLAIQNARLFRSIERWARAASRNAHQKDNIMQAIPDGIVIYDPRWRVAAANPAARALLGWGDDILGLSLAQAMRRSSMHFLSDDFTRVPDIRAELEQRALAGQVDELKVRGADDRDYTLRCSYTPIRDEVGDIFAFIVIYHDITEVSAARERIEAEVVARTAELAQRNAALQQARDAQALTSARMELLLKHLPSGVVLVNAQDNAIIVINERAVQILQDMGAPLEPRDDSAEAVKQAVGLNCEELVRQLNLYGPSGSLVPYDERPLHRVLTQGKANAAELHTTTVDGQMIYLFVNSAPLYSADGNVTSAILVLHDITAIKAVERARDDFFTTMAHELKTPLANIRAHLSALLAEDLQWSAKEQYEFLRTADEQVERLVGMVNHFLDASRVEAGALRLELEPILIPEMLEDLQERLEALISTSGRQLQITQPAQLPAVLADYELIMSVLSNLLSNAFRYAPEGDKVFLEIEPVFNGAVRKPVGVTMRVTDRGPGMTWEQQRQIFTRFSTFAAMNRPALDRPGQPAAERRRRGARWSPATGLGLYISRGIIEAHGSALKLKSNPGQGASFSFTLPVFVGKQRQNNQE